MGFRSLLNRAFKLKKLKHFLCRVQESKYSVTDICSVSEILVVDFMFSAKIMLDSGYSRIHLRLNSC
jgi:hypothetical protein